MSHKITIEFENKEQAEQFFGWLSTTGEQNFGNIKKHKIKIF